MALKLHCIATKLSGTICVDLSNSTASCREVGGGGGGGKHPETCQKFTRLSFSSEKGSTSGEAYFFCSKPESSGQPRVKKFGGCPYPTVCYKFGRQVATCQIECW